MLRKLYNWMMNLAAGKHAESGLFAVSFIESSVFPIPPDVMLVPMCIANRARAIRYATICTIASVLGGLFGYLIGAALFETVGQWVVATYGLEPVFAQFESLFAEWGWWLVICAGFTPFPYKVITISAGLFHLDLFVFTASSILSRGARFYLEAFLLYYYGQPIRDFIEKYLGLLTAVFFALLLGGFAAVKYLF